ncbi:MAG: alpha/beta hydrolase [Lachnospiraceae bacterium]
MMAADIVLIHGGFHTRACWDDVIMALNSMDGGCRVLAVTIPGHLHGSRGEEELRQAFFGLLIEDIERQIRAFSTGPVVVAAHSMGGIFLPEIVARLGREYIKHIVFISCCVPADSQNLLQNLPFPLAAFAGLMVGRVRVVKRVPYFAVRHLFANGVGGAALKRIRACLCGETTEVLTGTIKGSLEGVCKIWILTERDKALPPKMQMESIRRIGGVDKIIRINSCHEVIFTDAEKIAAVILKR